MKTKIRHEHVRRAILFVVPALGLTAVLFWSMLSSPKTATVPPVAPPLIAPSTELAVAHIASLPAPPVSPIPRSGPVADATDATIRATAAANSAALRDYGVEPFADTSASATFDGSRWSWQKRIGYRKGDFEAEVVIAPGGAVESVTVRYTTLQFAQRF
jgi:hypothetical protein